MKSIRFMAATALATISVFAVSGTAFAQQAAPADEAAEKEAEETKAIIVTGSRISRPNLESAVPIASIGGDQFLKSSDTNVGDTLNDLPQLRSTYSQQNPGSGIGIAGLNLLDLRGLGTSRTLVLVNGRRHVAADILNNAVSPDINTIPNDLIDRVDIVTGGNSAVYGSDAIAGVVNFVLRRNFEGLQTRARVGISEGGFGGSQYVSAMYGNNFGDGRGNITLHGEYAHQDRVFGSDVDWYRTNDGFGTVDLDSAGLTSNSDGVADRSFFRDFRSASINRYGLVPITQRTGNPVCGQGLVGTNGAASTVGGSSFNCTYIFTPAGELVQQTGTRFGSGIIGSIIGGNGQVGREDRLLSVVPKLDRYNFNMLGHYEFSDAAEVFVEAKWNRVNALGSNAGPSFIQGTQTQFDSRERVRLDNPFLSTTARTTIANAILASGCNTSLTASCAAAGNLTQAQRAQVAAGTYRFVISRNLLDSGIRDEKFQRDTWRIVGGLRGEFNTDWNYEVSVNYGKFKEDTTTYGYINRQRFMLAMDAGRNPLNGNIECRSKFDAASATPLTRADLSAAQNAANASRLAADIAACVPYNPFGAADNSTAAKYFTYNANHSASLDQLIISGTVGGNTSAFLTLPGGPIRFSLGGEYRREKAYYQQDSLVEGGYTNAVVIPTFDPPAFKVKEAYGEVLVPLLADVPFFHELTLSGAGRIAKYQGGTGSVWASNFGVEWSPVKDIRFRGSYARSVRAPNVSETAFPLVPNFAPGFADPCSPGRINSGTTFRNANCTADLGALLGNLNDTTYSLPIVSGSNPNLTAEKSDSWTLGTVIQPRFVPGLSVTVDYYNIKVNGIIASLTSQQLVNACYDQPTLANVFCSAFERYRGTGLGTGPFGENPGAVLGNSLVNAPLNYAKRQRAGIDTQVTYRTNITDNVKLYTNLIYTHNLKISNYQDATNPNFENRILGELGDPKDEFQWDVDLTIDKFTLGYRMHYIGPMVLNLYEDFYPLQDRLPQDADYADVKKYPRVFYHDLNFEWNIGEGGIGKDFQLYAGVNNIFDKHPPLGSTATGAGSAIYEYRGRNFYAGFKAKF
jgi:outer membrane receptor protein involved in Fe transport